MHLRLIFICQYCVVKSLANTPTLNMAVPSTVSVRMAIAGDMAEVKQLIQELSDVENVREKTTLTIEDLTRDGGFMPGTVQRFTCLVAEDDKKKPLVGYCMGFFKKFSDERRTLFIDSLYARSTGCNVGIVERLLAAAMIRYARNNGCQRVDLHVLSSNPARQMWAELGAVDLTTTQGIDHLRLHSDALQLLLPLDG